MADSLRAPLLNWLKGRFAQRESVRRVHLGVDFGTCWSKLVLRDYDARHDTCLVVEPPADFHGTGDYRIPSLVVLEGKRLLFGGLAQRRAAAPGITVYHSLKMRAALPEAFAAPDAPLPTGLSAEDLATLLVAFLLQIGRWAAASYSKTQGCVPKLSMTIGVPMSLLGEPATAAICLRIARMAWSISADAGVDLRGGLEVQAARRLLDGAAAAITRIGGVGDARDWVRSEAEAGLLWAFKSPDVAEGLYGCADIGAGTTDVSFFRIGARKIDDAWVKDGLAFYSARSGPPGVDALDSSLLAHFGNATLDDVRGREDALIVRERLQSHAGIRSIADNVFELYRKTWSDAYRIEMGQTRWGRFGLFVLGGGSRIDVLDNRLRHSVWKQIPNPFPADAGLPADLRTWSGERFNGDATFLLVAYGLSWFRGDVPRADSPDHVRALELPRQIRDPFEEDVLHQ